MTCLQAHELLSQQWSSGFSWLALRRDPVLNVVPPKDQAGSILLRIGMGLAPLTPPLHWEPEVEAALAMARPCELRVHVYQVCTPAVQLTCISKRMRNCRLGTCRQLMTMAARILMLLRCVVGENVGLERWNNP